MIITGSEGAHQPDGGEVPGSRSLAEDAMTAAIARQVHPTAEMMDLVQRRMEADRDLLQEVMQARQPQEGVAALLRHPDATPCDRAGELQRLGAIPTGQPDGSGRPAQRARPGPPRGRERRRTAPRRSATS